MFLSWEVTEAWQGPAEVGPKAHYFTSAAQVSGMARSVQGRGCLLSKHLHKDSSAEPLGYTPGPNCPTPPPFSSYFSPIQPHSPILLDALKDKGGSEMGGVPCPSPPSGAECLCQDIRLYKVMKDVIKVTACRSAACSIPALCRS